MEINHHVELKLSNQEVVTRENKNNYVGVLGGFFELNLSPNGVNSSLIKEPLHKTLPTRLVRELHNEMGIGGVNDSLQVVSISQLVKVLLNVNSDEVLKAVQEMGVTVEVPRL